MKMLHFIACIMLPISIINNGYTMEKFDYDNQKTNQKINLIKKQKQEDDENEQTREYLREKVVKFINGNFMCSFASLIQCLSVLNPGDNKILQEFIKKYNKSLNEFYIPEQFLEEVLKNVANNTNKINSSSEFFDTKTLFTPKEDVRNRYMRLCEFSKAKNSDIREINSCIALPELKEGTLDNTLTKKSEKGEKDIFGNDPSISDKTLNLVLCCDNMNIFKNFSDDICNETVTINGNTFDLVSAAFLELEFKVDENGNTFPSNKKIIHYVSAKKLKKGEWVLIDSNDYKFEFGRSPKYMFNSFRELVNYRVNNTINLYKSSKTKIRFLPKLLFYTKRINNNNINSVSVNNNINTTNTYSSNHINHENIKYDSEKNDESSSLHSQNKYKDSKDNENDYVELFSNDNHNNNVKENEESNDANNVWLLNKKRKRK